MIFSFDFNTSIDFDVLNIKDKKYLVFLLCVFHGDDKDFITVHGLENTGHNLIPVSMEGISIFMTRNECVLHIISILSDCNKINLHNLYNLIKMINFDNGYKNVIDDMLYQIMELDPVSFYEPIYHAKNIQGIALCHDIYQCVNDRVFFYDLEIDNNLKQSIINQYKLELIN